MDKRRFIPSMFHRRLVLALGCMLLVLIMLGAQLFRLSIVERPQHLREAESRLSQSSYLPTYRGMILDREMNVLAMDRPSYDVAVHYEVISGRWARRKAELQARREIGSEAWSELSAEECREQTEARLPEWEAQIERLWHMIRRFGELDEDELADRCEIIVKRVQEQAENYRERIRAEKGYPESKALPYGEEKKAHVILSRVPDDVAFEFRRFDEEHEGLVEVQSAIRREYPRREITVFLSRASLPEPIRSTTTQQFDLEGVADHIVGSMRHSVWEEDAERRPFKRPDGTIDLGGYRTGDVVGAKGMERAYEDHLRGLRGEVVRNLETDEKIISEPEAGGDLHTTINIELQARIQAILSPEFGLSRVQQWQIGWDANGSPRPSVLPLGTPLNSAAVVLEVSSGEILAMVSMPTLAMGEKLSESQRLVDTPFINRPYEALYAPGSIMKSLVLTSAVTEGVHNLDDPIECTGHYFEKSKDFARCWIYREAYGFQMHGELKASEAIGRSCNIFFYTLADRLGIERLIDWFGRFGIGTPLDIGLELPSEFADRYGEHWLGRLPDEQRIRKLRLDGEIDSATVFLGIGQGLITWTPLHAANAYATLARGGIIHEATLITADSELARPVHRRDMHLDPASVDAALEGLRQSVMSIHGTGHHILYPGNHIEPLINAQGVTVWAKTGTAQAPNLRHDFNGDGELTADEGISGLDHAWWVGLVGPKGGVPLYAISVIVEYGGSGGRTAGPIANQIIRALQAVHILPGNPNAPPEETG